MQVQHHNHYMQVKIDEGAPKQTFEQGRTSENNVIIVNTKGLGKVEKYPLILGNKKNSMDVTVQDSLICGPNSHQQSTVLYIGAKSPDQSQSINANRLRSFQPRPVDERPVQSEDSFRNLHRKFAHTNPNRKESHSYGANAVEAAEPIVVSLPL